VQGPKSTELSVEQIRRDQELALLLPPVVPSSMLRYCMFIEGEVGRPYVPAIARDYPSLPVVGEGSALSMTLSQFMSLYFQGLPVALTDTKAFVRARILCQDVASCDAAQALADSFGEAVGVSRAVGGVHAEFSKLQPSDPQSRWVFNSSEYRLTNSERDQLMRIVDVLSHEFDHASTWTMLGKVCVSEAQQVATYLYHCTKGRVKSEDGVNVELASSQLTVLFGVLEKELRARQQLNLDIYSRYFSRMVTKGRAGTGEFRGGKTEGDKVANPYFAPQQLFIGTLDRRWNRCEPPRVTSDDLVRLAVGIVTVDMDFFSLSVSTSDGETIDTTGTKEDKDRFISFIDRMLNAVWGNPDIGTKSDLSWFKQFIGQLHPSLDGKQIASFEFTCSAPANSWVLNKFRHFYFGNRGTASCTLKMHIDSLDPVFMYFLWFCYTTVIRPMVNHFDVLYPDTSIIRHSRRHSAATPPRWLDLLQPSDSTPVLNKQLYHVMNAMVSDPMVLELQREASRGTVVAEKAEAMLLAFKVLLSAQESLDLDDFHRRKLQGLAENADFLLQRRRRFTGGPAILPAGASISSIAQSTSRVLVQQSAQRMFVQCIQATRAIFPSSVHQLFEQLSPYCQPQEVVGAISVTLLGAFKKLTEMNSPSNPVVLDFIRCMKAWVDGAAAGQVGMPYLLKQIALKVLDNEEVRTRVPLRA